MKPRRKGKLTEYQNGRYFMYVTEWQEVDENQRQHKEIEVYFSPSIPVWNSTDPNIFDKALELFFDNPELFEQTTKANELPSKE